MVLVLLFRVVFELNVVLFSVSVVFVLFRICILMFVALFVVEFCRVRMLVWFVLIVVFKKVIVVLDVILVL